jgi:hypothetical protein
MKRRITLEKFGVSLSNIELSSRIIKGTQQSRARKQKDEICWEI